MRSRHELGSSFLKAQQHHEPALALDQDPDLGLVVGADDEVPLPVARHRSVVHLRREL